MKRNKLQIFRNSYLAICMILLCGLSATAQYDSTKVIQQINAAGYDYKNIIVRDGGMTRIPRDTIRMALRDSGAIAYKGGRLFTWNGRYWNTSSIRTIALPGYLFNITVSGQDSVTLAVDSTALRNYIDSLFATGVSAGDLISRDSIIYLIDSTVSAGGGGTLQQAFDAAPTAIPQINAHGQQFRIDSTSTFWVSSSIDYNDSLYSYYNLYNAAISFFSGKLFKENTSIAQTKDDVSINLTNFDFSKSTIFKIDSSKLIFKTEDPRSRQVFFGINNDDPTAPLHVFGSPRFETDSAAAGYVWTSKDATGQGEWRAASGSGSGITTAQLTDSINAREPRYKFRDDSTGNEGYTTLYQYNKGRDSVQANVNAKANTADPTFTGSLTLSSTTGGIGLPAMTQTQMNAISSPAVGTQVYNTTYDVVCTNTSDFGWWSNDDAWQRANGFSYNEEFFTNTTSAIGLIIGYFTGYQINSGTINNVIATANRPGILQLSTQTSANARSTIVLDGVATRSNVIGGGKLIFETQVQVPTLSSSTETFNFFTGLSSSTSNVSTNAIAFLYDSAGTNTGSSAIGRWQVVCSNGSNRSYTTTNVQVTAGQWYSLRAVINAAGTQVDFFIDGTPVRSETNNIPTGGVSYTYALTKTNGTTARSALVDYFFMRQKFTTVR